MKVILEGIESVIKMLDRALNLDRRIDEISRAFAMGTLGQIIRRTPVDTGFLKAGNVVLILGLGVNAFINYREYARYVEYGTGRRGGASYEAYLPEEVGPAYATYWQGMNAQPYMRPPIAEGLKEVDRRIDEVCRGI